MVPVLVDPPNPVFFVVFVLLLFPKRPPDVGAVALLCVLPKRPPVLGAVVDEPNPVVAGLAPKRPPLVLLLVLVEPKALVEVLFWPLLPKRPPLPPVEVLVEPKALVCCCCC